jgi:hypothetical protein
MNENPLKQFFNQVGQFCATIIKKLAQTSALYSPFLMYPKGNPSEFNDIGIFQQDSYKTTK